jgi:ubiquinone/menaquinone biosynthesis C-methylase UbiE
VGERHAAFIGSVPENYDRYLGPALFEPYARDLAGRLNVSDGASVLELACGTGILTRALRERLPRGARLTATDLNEAMMGYAARKFSPEEAVEWRQADAADLSFDDESEILAAVAEAVAARCGDKPVEGMTGAFVCKAAR